MNKNVKKNPQSSCVTLMHIFSRDLQRLSNASGFLIFQPRGLIGSTTFVNTKLSQRPFSVGGFGSGFFQVVRSPFLGYSCISSFSLPCLYHRLVNQLQVTCFGVVAELFTMGSPEFRIPDPSRHSTFSLPIVSEIILWFSRTQVFQSPGSLAAFTRRFLDKGLH